MPEEVAPTVNEVADAQTMPKRKRKEKVQPPFDRFVKNENEWRIAKAKRNARMNRNCAKSSSSSKNDSNQAQSTK
ncbi:hypothetical protein PtA15_13A168 [Puccinia triticina]|nr:uncharacterized protein PtA15_13A168 [Puccinia triticina]WAQ90769.1 hypothetical protein PtA15_13A168 [Puccinia triticina]WAR60954.1 hypothetical protein PtB15_13B205 [Puccinia triticina]